MSFAVPTITYERFMGRYARALAPLVCDALGAAPGMRALEATAWLGHGRA